MASACFYIECPATGMILAVSRKDDTLDMGLPGGKVEEGETELEAAHRELEEETGVRLYRGPAFWTPEIFRREGGVTFRGHTTNVFRYGKPRSEEGRVAWVYPEELLRGSFGAYNRALLKHIGKI